MYMSLPLKKATWLASKEREQGHSQRTGVFEARHLPHQEGKESQPKINGPEQKKEPEQNLTSSLMEKVPDGGERVEASQRRRNQGGRRSQEGGPREKGPLLTPI